MRSKAKHELFAQALADGLSQEAAYKKAGFTGKGARSSASTLLKHNPNISKRVEEILAGQLKIKQEAEAKAEVAISAEFELSRDDLLRKMYGIYEKAVAAEPVLNSYGQPIGEYRTNLAAGVTALKLLGSEVHGMFVEKKEVRTGDIKDLTEDELQERWDSMQKAAGLKLPKLPRLQH